MELLKIPATLSKYQGMSHRSMRMQFDSQENLTNDQIAKISQLHERLVWLCAFHEDSKPSEMAEMIKNLPPLVKEEGEKSPSKRLRDRMFVYWSEKKIGGDFNTWYVKSLEEIGNQYLEKLN